MAKSTHHKTNGLGRREFVKTSTLAAGSLFLMPSMLAAKAHTDGDDTIKVALVGCGGRGTGAAVQALLTKQNVKLVAMADAFRDKIDEAYAVLTADDVSDWSGTEGSVKAWVQVPEEHKFTGFDGYKKAIPLADVVILTTPPGFRPIHFEEAVRQGKHVFMEKPVATDAPGVRRVLEAAEVAKQKKLNVVVGLQRHYQTVYRQWVEMIQAGAIGEVVTSHVYWNNDGVWVRGREEFSQKIGRPLTEMEYQMRNWYYFNWLCGDHITEQHIHNLDVGNWVKNAYPVRAQGMGGRQVRVGKDFGEIFDHHFVEFEYEDGSRMFSQCRHQPDTMSRVTEFFQGTNGSAPRPGLLLTRSGHELFKHDDRNDPNPYQVEHDELFDAIAKGEYRFADAENGAKATMTSILGRMATYSGQVVEWKDAMASTVSLAPQRFAWDATPPVLPGADGMYACAVPGVTKVL
ncbi:MAG: Gfo/Idh/MocA family oxidoreductase [Bacteroidetes bacterium]|nr:Gfo/Idh/MocA family oxidoreductase [Bacteroidota bacterium]